MAVTGPVDGPARHRVRVSATPLGGRPGCALSLAADNIGTAPAGAINETRVPAVRGKEGEPE